MSTGTWNPAWLKDMTAWIANPSIPMYGRWAHAAQNEGGVDLTSAQGTPVYALADGPLLGAGTFGCNGACPNGFSYALSSSFGVVSQRITVPGYGTQDIYYQHINIDPAIKPCNNPLGSCNNQYVHRGQQIGTTGGFGEVEVGFNADWGGVWGTNHPGAWVTDPRPLIAALMNAGPAPTGTSTNPFLNVVGNAINAWKVQGNNPIAPDASVAAFFVGLDVALELQNPFNVSIDLSNTDITIPILNIDTGIPNPASDARAIFEGAQQIGINIVQDLSALAFRVFFIVVGLAILTAIGQHIVSTQGQQAADSVGGTQGVMKIVGALA